MTPLNVLHQVQAISEVDAERADEAAKSIPALQSNVEKYGTQLEAMQKERDCYSTSDRCQHRSDTH